MLRIDQSVVRLSHYLSAELGEIFRESWLNRQIEIAVFVGVQNHPCKQMESHLSG